MGRVKRVEVVMPICSVVSRYPQLIQWAIEQLDAYWGGLVADAGAVPFGAQEYYQKEMGCNLQKQMVSAAQPRDPGELADWKQTTNAWEETWMGSRDYPEQRPLNLDPGYISQGKLVLASAKDRDHRIYLRDGIFAEVTLRYRRQGWEPNAWTYRDYREEQLWQFADRCRLRLRQHLQQSDGFRR